MTSTVRLHPAGVEKSFGATRAPTNVSLRIAPGEVGKAFPAGVGVTLALAVLTSLLLRRTVFGRHVFALGSNEATARRSGGT